MVMYDNRGMRLDKVYFYRRVKNFMNIPLQALYIFEEENKKTFDGARLNS
jgi:hypothetical protein